VTADPGFPGSAVLELSFRIASGAEGHRFESCRARQPSLALRLLRTLPRELRLATPSDAPKPEGRRRVGRANLREAPV